MYDGIFAQGFKSDNFYFSGPLISNKVLSEAITKTKLMIGENFKCFVPGVSTAIDDIYTPLEIFKETIGKQPQR